MTGSYVGVSELLNFRPRGFVFAVMRGVRGRDNLRYWAVCKCHLCTLISFGILPVRTICLAKGFIFKTVFLTRGSNLGI